MLRCTSSFVIAAYEKYASTLYRCFDPAFFCKMDIPHTSNISITIMQPQSHLKLRNHPSGGLTVIETFAIVV